jgi:hypothetical protein
VIVAGPRPDRVSPRADWTEGDDATVIELDRDVSTSDTVNRVIVRSTSTAGVWAVVEDDDPGSATWVGRYGPYERMIESDAVSTPAGALSMARMQYGRLRLPTESVSVRVPVRPDLDYRDPVILRRDPVRGRRNVPGVRVDDPPRTVTIVDGGRHDASGHAVSVRRVVERMTPRPAPRVILGTTTTDPVGRPSDRRPGRRGRHRRMCGARRDRRRGRADAGARQRRDRAARPRPPPGDPRPRSVGSSPGSPG